jgi:hypothetical protein
VTDLATSHVTDLATSHVTDLAMSHVTDLELEGGAVRPPYSRRSVLKLLYRLNSWL